MATTTRRERAPKDDAPEVPAKRATRVRASRLLAALKDVTGIVSTKTTIPILAHVMLEAGHGVIRVSATDMDMEARRECASDDKGQPDSADWCANLVPFAVTTPGKALLAIVAGFDGDAMVTLTLDENVSRLVISAGRSRFRLVTLPVSDFPRLRDFEVEHEFEIRASAWADAIDVVEHAISTEETRYYLNGIYVHPDGLDLCLATTDGHRLARAKIDAPDGAHSWPPMIIPRGAIGELAKALAHAAKASETADVVIRCNQGGNVMSFDMPAAEDGSLLLITKAIDGTFPDYIRVIPVDPPRELTVHRETLAAAVARVSALASKESRLIRLDIETDRIDLTATSVEVGEAREEVPAVHDGEPQPIGFDAKYLREVLGKIASDDVVMRWTDGGAPVRIEASGSQDGSTVPRLCHVLMPVRV